MPYTSTRKASRTPYPATKKGLLPSGSRPFFRNPGGDQHSSVRITLRKSSTSSSVEFIT